MMPSEPEAFEVVRDKIHAHFGSFARLGLEFITTYTEPSRLTSPTLWFQFKKSSDSYGVTIAFSTVRNAKEGLFQAFIVRPDGLNLSVKNYLHSHKLFVEEGLFSCTKDASEFAVYVEAFLTCLESLLDGQLKPFLDGRKWESVPIDLAPYK